MNETIDVDDFLMHFGVPGMKWGKRRARSQDSKKSSSNKGSSGGGSETPKPKMSKQKKIAIAVGIGAVLAIGTAVAVSSMNKNMDVPIQSLMKNASLNKGKAVVEAARKATAPKNGFDPRTQGRSFAPVVPSTPRSTPSAPSGLTLSPSRQTANTPTTGLTLPRSSSSSNSTPRSMSAGPNLNSLASLINGGPQITFNSRTGQYETR